MHRAKVHAYRNVLNYHRKRRGLHALHHASLQIALPIVLIFVAITAATGTAFLPSFDGVDIHTLMLGLGASFLRLLIAYLVSVILAFPLALLAERNHVFEAIFLPVYDVLESIPILAFFPVIILFFVRYDQLEFAAILMLVLNMLWNLVFNIVGGLKLIPKDIHSAAHIFGYSGSSKFRFILLPALFPALVTGSILAVAEGWNMLIVAEVLHAYVPQTANVADLFGIGSQLVAAASSGNTPTFIAAAGIIVIAVAFINLSLWQPMLAQAERYKFE